MSRRNKTWISAEQVTANLHPGKTEIQGASQSSEERQVKNLFSFFPIMSVFDIVVSVTSASAMDCHQTILALAHAC